MNGHYIYTLTDPNNGVVKYVGQGKNRRYTDWFRAKPDWEFQYGVKPWLWSLKKAGTAPIVTKVLEGLTQKQANAWEIGLIDFIGRKKDTGPLLNIADGGAGSRGVKRTDETIRKRLKTRGFKTLEDCVQAAQILAEANGGKLPNDNWLRNNKHWSIINALRQHPEAFNGLEQVRKYKTLDEHVEDAKKLATANGGKLPGRLWLIRNKHSGLDHAMQNNPDAFADIDQERTRRTLVETVEKAKTMAEANGGKLQNSKWLENNGHNDILHVMRKHPEAFKDIDQSRLRRKCPA